MTWLASEDLLRTTFSLRIYIHDHLRSGSCPVRLSEPAEDGGVRRPTVGEPVGNVSVTVGSTRLPERCCAQILYFVAPIAYNKKPLQQYKMAKATIGL